MGMVGAIIGLTLGAIMLSSVFFPQVFGANTTGWDTGTIAIWTAVGVVAGASFLYAIAASLGVTG